MWELIVIFGAFYLACEMRERLRAVQRVLL